MAAPGTARGVFPKYEEDRTANRCLTVAPLRSRYDQSLGGNVLEPDKQNTPFARRKACVPFALCTARCDIWLHGQR